MKQELIEFLTEVSEHKDDYMLTRHKLWAKQLLCSINSNESNEFRTVGNNEQDGSICPDCKGEKVKGNAGGWYECHTCNGTGQI